MLIDVHCHLDLLEDLDSVLEAAKSAGVKRIITNGTSPKNNRAIIALAKRFDLVDVALGLYPHDAVKLSVEQVNAELDFIKSHRPVAIGEVGLDYHYECEDPDWMREVFEKILKLAQSIKRPVIVHSRKAESDVIDMISKHNVVADLHCFGGSLKLARKAAGLGCYFSIPPVIVRSTHFQRLVEETPMKLLLTETDSPYLSPDENPNHPANVRIVVDKIAQIKGLTFEECANHLWMNANNFLR